MLKTNTTDFRINVIGIQEHTINNEPVNVSEDYYNCLMETLYLYSIPEQRKIIE